jgi:hypothetical protein
MGAAIKERLGRAVSSAVERLVYTEDVGSSILSPPTSLRGPRPLRLASQLPAAWLSAEASAKADDTNVKFPKKYRRVSGLAAADVARGRLATEYGV